MKFSMVENRRGNVALVAAPIFPVPFEDKISILGQMRKDVTVKSIQCIWSHL